MQVGSPKIGSYEERSGMRDRSTWFCERKTVMRGVQYLVDDKGEPQAVVIDLKKNRALWEDLQDLMIAKERRTEPRESAEEVTARIKKKRKEAAKK